MIGRKKRFNSNIFSNILIFILICASLIIILSAGRKSYRGELQEGDIAAETVYAPFDFTVKGEIDQQVTDKLREKAEQAAPKVYVLNDKVLDLILKQIDAFFNKVSEVSSVENIDEKEKTAALSEVFQGIEKNALLNLLQRGDYKSLLEETKKIVSKNTAKGIISSEEKNRLLNSGTNNILVKTLQEETLREVISLTNVEDCRKNIEQELKEKFNDKTLSQALSQYITSKLAPNIFYSEEETMLFRQKAKKAVASAYKKITIAKDEIVISKNQRVTREHITYLHELLTRLDEKQVSDNRLFYISGVGILSVVLISLAVFYFVFYRRKFFAGHKNFLLIGVLSVFTILTAKIITLSFASSYLIPIAGAAMCLAILIDCETAVISTIILGLFIGIITGNKFSMVVISVTGGLVGIFGVRQVRRRSQILKAGLLVGLTNFICIGAIGLLQNLHYTVFLKDSLWGIGNGVLSSFIVTGILPVLEYSFKNTTNISLLELSDLNHPLLKEMVFAAPGTYHHSLIVGNLAEAAADAVGANSLLARVASYYHDIGKLKNAEYFAENKVESRDRHTKLSPEMSTLVITNHVKEGVELAKKHKLSQPILDIIQQHHGTSLTFYFYQRAVEEHGEDVKPQDFRYIGPKPQTKEAAIVLLADSVEAASRTIQEPTSAKIEKMVHRIINNKFIDGQLDECDLTLKDLHKIAVNLTRILVGIYHSRIDYPQQNEEKKENGPQIS